MNHYSMLSLKDCNFNLSYNVLGKDFVVDKGSPNTIDDDILSKIVSINRLDFVPVALL